MDPRIAQRLQALPPYLFDDIDKKKQAAIDAGVDVIDLGVGDPDLPTPDHIIAALAEASRDPANHPYPPYRGKKSFLQSAARYMKRRFGVEVDAAGQVVALIGSKEGIGHLPVALIDPGDVVLVPDPGYPVYRSATKFVGGEVFRMPLTRENGFQPQLDQIPADVAKRAKLMWLNYPHNPTGATATLELFQRVADFAAEHDIIVAHDCAYAEIYFDDPAPPSMLEIESVRDRVIEFHSFSKTFNMTGWRLAFATGTEWVVQALAKVKTNMDSGTFGAVQDAGVAALDGDWKCVEDLRARYLSRRRIIVDALAKAGLEHVDTRATFFVLAAVPAGKTSLDLAGELLERAGLVVTPCIGFGEAGDSLIRLSLTAPEARLEEAASRLASLGG